MLFIKQKQYLCGVDAEIQNQQGIADGTAPDTAIHYTYQNLLPAQSEIHTLQFHYNTV